MIRSGAKLVGVVILSLVICSPVTASDDSSIASITELAAHQQWAQASTQIELYRQKHPDSITAAVLQAEILLHMGLLSDANGVLQRILAIHPHSVEALGASAELSRTIGDKAAAEQLFLRCTQYAPRSPEAWKRLGEFYLSSARREALAAFERAEFLAPNDALIQADMASAYHQAGDDEQAKRDFQRAIHLNNASSKPDATVYYLFAQFLQDKNQYQESLTEYGRALERDHDFIDAHLGRAQSLVRLHQWAGAQSELQICLNDQDHQIAALNLLIKVAQAQGNSEEAQTYATRAEELSSAASAEKAANNQIASQLQNAHASMLNGKFAEAAQSYEHLLADHPEVSEAWLQLGRCQWELGQLEEAESNVRHFLAVENASASGHLLLGRILLGQKQSQKAREQFMQSKKDDPQLMDASLGIAASYIFEDNFPEAIATLRKLDTRPGANPAARLMLTEALYKNNQLEDALREIDRVLKQDPNNREAQEMKMALLQERAR
jgi:tetratricopeptide (TPR) repeat protein